MVVVVMMMVINTMMMVVMYVENVLAAALSQTPLADGAFRNKSMICFFGASAIIHTHGALKMLVIPRC